MMNGNKNLMRKTMSNELREKVKDLMAEYPITDILNALWSNVDEIRMELAENPESYISQEKNEEMLKAKSDSAKLFKVWFEFNSHC